MPKFKTHGYLILIRVKSFPQHQTKLSHNTFVTDRR